MGATNFAWLTILNAHFRVAERGSATGLPSFSDSAVNRAQEQIWREFILARRAIVNAKFTAAND